MTKKPPKAPAGNTPRRTIRVPQSDWDAWIARAADLGLDNVTVYIKMLVKRDITSAKKKR